MYTEIYGGGDFGGACSGLVLGYGDLCLGTHDRHRGQLWEWAEYRGQTPQTPALASPTLRIPLHPSLQNLLTILPSPLPIQIKTPRHKMDKVADLPPRKARLRDVHPQCADLFGRFCLSIPSVYCYCAQSGFWEGWGGGVGEVSGVFG